MQQVDSAWGWIIVAASFLCQCIIYGTAWSVGIFNSLFLDAFNESGTVTSWASSLLTSMLYFSGPLSSILSNRFGCRPIAILGSVITASGLILSYFATSIHFLYFSFGIVTGLGVGITYVPSITIVGFYFEKRRSVAVGIVCSGVGLGVFIYPPVIRYIMKFYEWRETLLLMGAFSLNMCVFSSFFRPIRRSELDQSSGRPILERSLLRKKAFMMFALNNFLICFGLSIVYTHLPRYGEVNGLSSDDSALLISTIGIPNLVGRILFGILLQHPRFDASILYLCSFGIVGLMIALLGVFKTYEGMLVLASFFGFFSGCWGTLIVPILIQLLGLSLFATGYGLLLLVMSAGQLLGAPAASFCIVYLSTEAPFYLAGAIFIVSSALMIFPYRYKPRNTDQLLVEGASDKLNRKKEKSDLLLS